METTDPLGEYLSRLEMWRTESRKGQRLFLMVGNIRLAVVILAVALAWVAFGSGSVSGWTLLVPLAAFIALLIYHERVVRRQEFAKRAVTYYEHGLARLDDRWAGTGNPGDRFQDAAHIYSGDLDVFGRGSLFELLCVARTAEGEERLAAWLLAPADREEVAARQSAIADLRDRITLREDIAMLGDDIRSGVHAAALTRWASAPPAPFPAGTRVLALLLSVWNIVAFGLFMSQVLSARVFLGGVAAALLFGFVIRKSTASVAAAADTAPDDLQILGLLLERLEREQFQSPRLTKLRAALEIEGLPASARIHRLRRWKELLDSGDHLVVRVIGPALLWRQQVAMAIEAWRQKSGPRVGIWIESVAELEALSSMAVLAFERPTWTTPELLDGEPSFSAAKLRHPLMNPQHCVPNDIAIGGETRLIIVSGSNMSGKSTLLRAVGLNSVLAWMGAPVSAASLKVSRVSVAASMRVVDSLQDGKSRFYAEITRLRAIVDLASRKTPVLFLLDELLSGTNSHDRRIGAEAVVSSLVERGAIGFVTTHDLALTQIAAVNVHFEDHIVDGRIHFDYKMREGIVKRSNALELMRAVGLDV